MFWIVVRTFLIRVGTPTKGLLEEPFDGISLAYLLTSIPWPQLLRFAYVLLPPPPVNCTSAMPALLSSIGCLRGKSVERWCCASKTPTLIAAKRALKIS